MRVSQTSSCRLHGTQAPFSNIDEGREVACALIYERKMGRETDIKKSEGQGRERKGMTESWKIIPDFKKSIEKHSDMGSKLGDKALMSSPSLMRSIEAWG